MWNYKGGTYGGNTRCILEKKKKKLNRQIFNPIECIMKIYST